MAVKRYFASIRDQVLTLSEDQVIVEAMVGFKSSFQRYASETNVTPERIVEMRTTLATYYTGEFATEYKTQNDTAIFDASETVAR